MLIRFFILSLFAVCTFSAIGGDADMPPASGYVVASDGSILVGSGTSQHAPVCFLGCP